MTRTFSKSKNKLLVSFLAISTLTPVIAHAEISVGLLGGLANYTTQVHGDALFPYSPTPGERGFYFLYPQDINIKDAAVGGLLRYTRCLSPCFSWGAETGYVYLGINQTRQRSDNVPTANAAVNVENFTTKSTGVVLLNAVLQYHITPCVLFNIFAGPAWLNTQYIANDYATPATRTTSSDYQLTADAGVEAEWKFSRCLSASMRFDYIFDTNSRTVSTTGSLGDPLNRNMTAKSGAVLSSATLRYVFPDI